MDKEIMIKHWLENQNRDIKFVTNSTEYGTMAILLVMEEDKLQTYDHFYTGVWDKRTEMKEELIDKFLADLNFLNNELRNMEI